MIFKNRLFTDPQRTTQEDVGKPTNGRYSRAARQSHGERRVLCSHSLLTPERADGIRGRAPTKTLIYVHILAVWCVGQLS